MYACMDVPMYVRMYRYMYVRVYVCRNACTCVYNHISVRTYACVLQIIGIYLFFPRHVSTCSCIRSVILELSFLQPLAQVDPG